MLSFEKLKPQSYEQFLAEFTVPTPSHFNFAYDVVDDIAARDPHRLAMIHVDNNGHRREFDFEHFSRRSQQLASALTKMGLTKGDRVMLIMFRRMEYWEIMLALHRIGALPIPSPFLLTRKDIVQRSCYADIKAMICEDSIVERVEQARPDSPSFRYFIQVGGDGPRAEGWHEYEALLRTGEPAFPRTDATPCDRDPMVIFFTSGTSGPAKMVCHDHLYPLGHFTTGVYWHDLEPGDIHLTVSDTGWGKSVWGKFYGQWIAGAVVFVWDFRGKFVPAHLLDIISRHKITTFCAPPTIYRFLIREDLRQWDLSNIRHCTTAGELLNHSVFDDWKAATGRSIYQGYGQTETCLQVAAFPFMPSKPCSIGRPTPGWNLTLLDENGVPCPPGEEGEICIGLEGLATDGGVLGLFDGYMDEPEKTSLVKRDGYYHTGDKAWIDEDGYYWFMGRTDDLIKSSGYRIGPFEVESALVSHEAVIEAAVTGVPDPVRGMLVKATVVLDPEYDPSEELTKALQNHVKAVTAPYKYPRLIEFVDELPKTVSGKIKRAEIREHDRKRYRDRYEK